MENAVKLVDEVYDKLTFMDIYGGSVLVVFVISFIVFLIWSYLKLQQTGAEIRENWSTERCKLSNMVFAGQIMDPPEGQSRSEYTRENFSYCLQNILLKSGNEALKPFEFITSTLTAMQSAIATSVNSTRTALSNVRSNISDVVESIFQRMLNVMIPLQQMFIVFLDTLGKTQAVLTASLYTFFGSYMTLQSLMGAILEMIIKILVTLTVLIVGLWVVPVTWPAASAATAVYLSIAVPTAIIAGFMTEVLHVKSSGIPKLRCFHGMTRCQLKGDGVVRFIRDVKVGDVLWNGDVVTSCVQVSSAMLVMYKFRGVILSGNHKVWWKNRWQRVDEISVGPRRILGSYSTVHPYVYCLNTSSKTIRFPFLTCADWDEIYGESLQNSLLSHHLSTAEELNALLIDRVPMCDALDVVTMMHGEGKTIQEIQIGDVLKHPFRSKNIVYGIVRGFGGAQSLLTTTGQLIVNSSLIGDYNSEVDSILIQQQQEAI